MLLVLTTLAPHHTVAYEGAWGGDGMGGWYWVLGHRKSETELLTPALHSDGGRLEMCEKYDICLC